MSVTTGPDSEAGGKEARGKLSLLRLAGSVWRWVAPAYAAFGIAEIVRHYWNFEWYGLIGTVVALWEGARAVATGFFHGLVTIPSEWFGGHVVVPLLVRDYLAVGAMLSLSYLRTARGRRLPDLLRPSGLGRSIRPNRRNTTFSGRPERPWLAMAYVVALWPILLAFTLTVGVGGSLLVRTQGRARWDRAALGFPGYDFDEPMSYWRKKGFKFNPWSHFATEAFARSVVRGESTSKAIRDLALSMMLILSPLMYLALLLAVNFWVMPHIS